jgi:hypothetical protein
VVFYIDRVGLVGVGGFVCWVFVLKRNGKGKKGK